MHTNREMFRIEGITRSPIVSFFGESMGGLFIVRAFAK
jgi:ATP-binding cassette subfamily C (CFTR/MRP) protein 2